MKKMYLIITGLLPVLAGCGGLSEMYSDLMLNAPVCVDGVRGNDSNDGRGWANAVRTLKTAVEQKAENGKEIWIAGDQNIDDTTMLDIRLNVSIYGGFNGNEQRREERPDGSMSKITGAVTGSNSTITVNAAGKTVTIERCFFTGQLDSTDCITVSGGSRAAVQLCSFSENSSYDVDHLLNVMDTATLSVSDCVFKNNNGAGNGVCIYFSGNSEVTVTDSLFIKNAPNGSGAIYANNSPAVAGAISIVNCIFKANTNGAAYGGALSFNSVKNIFISGCTFGGEVSERNFSQTEGGAMYASNTPSVIVEKSAFLNNAAESDGGAILCNGTNPHLSIAECTFKGNTAQTLQGGAIYFAGSASYLTIDKCSFIQNYSFNEGGALFITTPDCRCIITASVFETNKTGAGSLPGGAIFSNGSILSVSTSSFSNNESLGHGGAVSCDGGTADIDACIFNKNTSSVVGGGMYYAPDAYSVLTNSVFYNNNAGNGGGLYAAVSDGLLSNLTFYLNNAVTNDGAVYTTVPIYNSVFYGNSASQYNDIYMAGGNIFNCYWYGGISGSGTLYNCITNNPASPFVSTDPANADFLRPSGALADRGVLPPGVSLPLKDAAGNQRVRNGMIDIGAYERP